ncbi:hypothetical protein T492DRAFT_1033791 [Pavlovales sp. CCMP2436]|nr:hypothetical protein T492DRAFT_1033791 [Pavlovales sp. CCMP2436]
MWTALGSLSAYKPLTVQASSHRLLKVAAAEADKAARENPGALVTISEADAKAAADSAAPRKSSSAPRKGSSGDRPSQHLRDRSPEELYASNHSAAAKPSSAAKRQVAVPLARQPAAKRRRTTEAAAAGFFLEIPPALLNGTVTLSASDLFRARGCANSLFGALDEMLRPYETVGAAEAPGEAAGKDSPAEQAAEMAEVDLLAAPASDVAGEEPSPPTESSAPAADTADADPADPADPADALDAADAAGDDSQSEAASPANFVIE